ncbi:MAG: cation:proton antiporter [Deltaproteobacteria bacterium]|nr:cation:proton antiporter [Deltaproteobacteria bacterium]
MYENLAILAIFAFLYSVVSGRLDRTPVNGAVVYLVFGVIAGPVGLGFLDLSIGTEGIRLVAELTLALVLFTDASNANFAVLRRVFRLPGRLLLVGLPLTILFGMAVGFVLFPELGWIEIAVLATMLAPTDAALGKAVVSNPAVPATVRQGLNVESGFNDGICVPILFTFLALASGEGAGESQGAIALHFLTHEVGIGLGVGLGFAATGAWLLRRAADRGWIEGPWLGIPIAALAFACFTTAQSTGGSGFIACFCGGLAFGALTSERKVAVLEGAETIGEALSLLTWVAFGAAAVLQYGGEVDWRVVSYAVLSLTVVRMLPVFLCVTGLGVSTDAKLFLGWFGPRGLASIVFVVIVGGHDLPGGETLITTVIVTVVLSILAHGLTANPLSTVFAARREA